MHGLVPELGVLLLVGRGLAEEGRYLLVAVLLGLGSVVLVLDTGLGFTGESGLQILKSLAVLEFHGKPPEVYLTRNYILY